VDEPSNDDLSRKRLLAIASSGGHWTELARLSHAFEDFDVLYATTVAGLQAPSGNRPLHLIPDASRSRPLKLMPLAVQLLRLLRRFRPHVIVTTGAAPGLLAIMLGTLTGSKTVWIDSIANAETLSLSGRLARRWATVRLTQWPALADAGRGLVYLGRVV
jgi:UDP-N-acetylglucosamine:LPS N-acetylglucosamine transferase